MKHSRRYFLGAISTLSILPLSMSNATNVHKAAILLYSRSGNTATLADFIREQIQAPIFRISPKVPYNADYSKMTDGARAEVRNGAYRELASPLPYLSNYDTIFLGSPYWWGSLSVPMSSFLMKSPLDGKNIFPFITSGSSSPEGALERIKELCPHAKIGQYFYVSGTEAHQARQSITNWLKTIGF